MNAKPLIPLIAAMLFPMSAYAHDCSGGASGGMDATGNQCNDAATIEMIVSSDGATFPSTCAPKDEAKPSASCNSDSNSSISSSNSSSTVAPSVKHASAKHTKSRHTALYRTKHV